VYSEQFGQGLEIARSSFRPPSQMCWCMGCIPSINATSREGVRDSVSVAIVTFMSSFTTDKTNQWLLNYHFWGFLAVEDALCNMTATWEAHPPCYCRPSVSETFLVGR
jgi:hypothetical protein